MRLSLTGSLVNFQCQYPLRHLIQDEKFFGERKGKNRELESGLNRASQCDQASSFLKRRRK